MPNPLIYIYIYIYIYISWPIIVVGDPKAPFSIATILRCRGGRYSLPNITPLTLDPYLKMLSAKQENIKNHLLCLSYDPT